MEAAWLLWQEKNGTIAGEKDALASLISLLVRVLQPERIFLLAYEEGTRIDLLVVVPAKSSKSFGHYGTIIETVCHGISKVSFSLHSSDGFKQHIEEGQPFWLLGVTESKQVYQNSSVPFPVPPPGKREEVKARAEQIFHTGLARAAGFWQSAKTGWEEENNVLALFLIHQSAELTCRALIQSLTGSEVKEHSVAILTKHLRRCAPGINRVFPADTERETALLSLLDSAYLKARYTDCFAPGKEEVLTLLERVGLLQDTADDIFTGLITAISA